MEKKTITHCKKIWANNESACGKVLDMASMLSNKIRLQIVCILTEGDFCVGDIVEAIGAQMSNVSQQLKILNLGGYVSKTRDRRNIIYSLCDDRVRDLIRYLHKNFG